MDDNSRSSAGRRHFSWHSPTTFFRAGSEPNGQDERCGVVEARASLRRQHRGWRGLVRLAVTPSAADEAIAAADPTAAQS